MVNCGDTLTQDLKTSSVYDLEKWRFPLSGSSICKKRRWTFSHLLQFSRTTGSDGLWDGSDTAMNAAVSLSRPRPAQVLEGHVAGGEKSTTSLHHLRESLCFVKG